MPTPSESQRVLMDSILNLAATDRDFRRLLLVEPRPAIREVFGVEIPETFAIRFVERDPDVQALIVLPDFRGSIAEGELSEDELEAVAGGTETGYLWDDPAPPPPTTQP